LSRRKRRDKYVKDNESYMYLHRAYYLTEEIVKAITIKTAEGELDKSGVVREALEIYLADILKEIRERKNQKKD
jgi:hypothetical protein